MSDILSAWATAGLASISLLAVGACTTRGEDPLIHDTTYGSFRISDSIVDVFGTNASRRMVIVRNERKKGQSGKEKENFLTFCAEPPPDVGEAFTAAVATSLQAAVSTSQAAGPQAGAAVAGAFARELATQIAPLLYRTQGLQLYRDAQFGLCNDMMSEYIDEKEYTRLKTDRFNTAVALIKAELPQLGKTQEEQFKSLGGKVGTEDAMKNLTNIAELNRKNMEGIQEAVEDMRKMMGQKPQ